MKRHNWSGEVGFAVERDGEELCLIVAGTVSPVIPGRFWGPPEKCHEAEGGDVELGAIVLDEQGSPAWGGALTDAEEEEAMQLLREKCDEDAEQDEPPEPDDFDDRYYERDCR